MYKSKQFILFLIILSFGVVSLSGCAGIRRKFIRQKKNTKQDKFIPVLDPVEYQVRYKTPVERYRKAYGMWKVWDQELSQLQERGGTDKRYKYVVEQMIAQCESMGQLLENPKRQEMEMRLGELYSLMKHYEKPIQLRNQVRIQSETREHGRNMRDGLNPDAIANFYIQLEGS